MMSRLKRWLFNKFLPAWCREELMEENARLRERLAEREQEVGRLRAHIGGMREALRLSKWVTIRNGGGAVERVVRDQEQQ